MKKTNGAKNLIFLGILIILASILAIFATADPSGTTISGNITDLGGTTTAANMSDAGGTITTMQMDAVQQDTSWKAYLGNMTGTLTLDDSAGNTIFDWALTASDISGEVYVSRANSISWSLVNCSTQSIINTEQTALGIASTAVDRINNTFNETTHQEIIVAGRTISADTCLSTATFESDARPVQATANFQEILFDDDTNMIYVAPLSQDTTTYDGSSTADFQLIVADDPTITDTTYYFYAEISG